jgi:hypothetical protein
MLVIRWVRFYVAIAEVEVQVWVFHPKLDVLYHFLTEVAESLSNILQVFLNNT